MRRFADAFNSLNTAEFLKQIRFRYLCRQIDLTWDNDPQHKGSSVKEAIENTKIRLNRLPGYSPELNAIETLWRWIREEMTYCHDTLQSLREHLSEVECDIKKKPKKSENDFDRIFPKSSSFWLFDFAGIHNDSLLITLIFM